MLSQEMLDKEFLVVARNNDIEGMKYWLEKGANINAKNKDGDTALHLAINIDAKREIIEFLLESGADTAVLNSRNLTAIDTADIYLAFSLIDKQIRQLLKVKHS